MGLLLATKEREFRLPTFAHGPIDAHVKWLRIDDREIEIKIRLRKVEPGEMKLSLAFGTASRALWLLFCEAELEEKVKEVIDSWRKP